MKLLLALTLELSAPEASTEMRGFLDAATLEHHCSVSQTLPEGSFGICLGYVAGSVDQILAREAEGEPALLCPPPDLTVEQVRSTFLAYLRVHPKERVSAAALVVERAVLDAYPCAQTEALGGRLGR